MFFYANEANQFFNQFFIKFFNHVFFSAVEAANVNAVDCSSVLRVTVLVILFVCFYDSFLCSISLLLLFDSLSCVLNCVL